MTDNITLPDTDTNMALVNALLDNGWGGKWEQKGGKIVIETDGSGPLKRRPLEYYEIQRLAICLAIQMEQMVKINKSYLYFDLEDISVIDDNWYIINSYDEDSDKIVDIDSDTNSVEFVKPVRLKGDYMAPELKTFFASDGGELPFNTNVSCVYYSVALLMMDLLDIESVDVVNGSPLYFFLTRCLENDPDNRFFLFV
jgi:hypothetical protein|tara:strand:- start:191 stop:784 length:594 start_codon:yes stop_codon:yes gene_type:complete